MITKQANAIEILKEVVQSRNWHKGLIKRNIASELKRNLVKGMVSYEKACQVLVLIGYEKVEEEVWQIKNAHSMQA